MEYRSLPVVALLTAVFLVAASAGARAGEVAADQQADWEARLAKGKALQADGKERKAAAEATLEAEKLACEKKFRVYDCHAEARQRYVVTAKEARRLENEGAAIERQVKKEQLADRDQRRRQEAPQREADLREREAETQADREAAASRQAERMATKEQQAAEGARRQAADAERQRLKREKHERRVAEKLDKARRREAESQ